jgi:hypothetical protein
MSFGSSGLGLGALSFVLCTLFVGGPWSVAHCPIGVLHQTNELKTTDNLQSTKHKVLSTALNPPQFKPLIVESFY